MEWSGPTNEGQVPSAKFAARVLWLVVALGALLHPIQPTTLTVIEISQCPSPPIGTTPLVLALRRFSLPQMSPTLAANFRESRKPLKRTAAIQDSYVQLFQDLLSSLNPKP